MDPKDAKRRVEETEKQYPEKFLSEEKLFERIRRGDRIFIGTGCGEPQYLVQAFIDYVKANPKGLFDAEILHIWSLGVTPYADEKFKRNFRFNSFFVGNSLREAVNKGTADYTPIFMSEVPGLFYQKIIPVDVALVQTTPPDGHGYLQLGISVDIVKAAVEMANLVIVQVNSMMPRVQGDGFIHMKDVDFIVFHDEPLLEYGGEADDEIARQIGKYVSRLVQDGDTIQVGYGSIPNAIVSNLDQKNQLGIHTELLGDGIVTLIKKGVVDNTQKSIDRGKTVAAFCMGRKETYEFIHDNPTVELRTIDYTNNPSVIAQHANMVAINSALEIDLTGQATAESIGKAIYSGIGGQADFMRGAALARNGKTILVLPSTTKGDRVSRIVPFLKEGVGITLHRGDVRYVVTEYGIAYLKGKSLRERAMELIAIAHPKFRQWLVDEAKKANLIYKDQAFVPGEKGEYPEALETFRTTKTGLEILLRPVKISDEPLVKEFFHGLSDESLYRRFFSVRQDLPHELLQRFAVIDYTKQMVILAVIPQGPKEEIIGIGQYWIQEEMHTADVAFAVRDDYQNKGIAYELFRYLFHLARRRGLLGFTADVLMDNRSMMRLCRKMGLEVVRTDESGVYNLKMMFRNK
jgi:acyl-CoA hydrolase/GNAT superfamily N-acetyltransferase